MARAFCTSITHDITFQEISDLLITAFEGGSNYWIKAVHYVDPPEPDWMPDGTLYGGEKHPRYSYVPLCEGGSMLIKCDDCPDWKVLNKEAITRGLKLLEKEEHSRHLLDIVNDNADAATADIFLQLCLFGEVVYG